MTDMDGSSSKFFVTGGNLEADAPSYVKRSVDDELFNLVLAGEFCYGLTARQMGKSSLMVRTAQRLQTHGVKTVIIDLTTIGSSDVSVDQWYQGLLKHLQDRLKLSVDPESWWRDGVSLGPVQRFIIFLRDVVLAEIEGPVVIFVDEIDTTLNLPFSDDFFAAIRSLYNARATDPIYHRLTFVLFGVATPGDLIKDRSRTPFNIGHRLDIHEFNRTEASVLQQGLQDVYSERDEAILDRIFDWTYGHPYLTQKLCRQVVETDSQTWTDEQIDQLVEKLFLSDEARTETNLQFVRDNIQDHPQRGRLLALYRQVHTGQAVPEDERSMEQNRLKLLGLVRVEKRMLKVRNEIYRRAFDREWIEANIPSDRTRQIIIASVVVIILLILGIGFVRYQQAQQTIEARATTAAENFTLASADVRLDSLAELLTLPGYADKARRMFYELALTEQQSIFNLANPQAVEEQLITVVKGLYTDPSIQEQGNELLQAMVQPLAVLSDADDYTIKNLAIELDSWSQGREHHAQSEYQQAVIDYETAIGLNPQNPATHFDRALAYTALDEPEQALADLETVLNLDEAWQEQVRQVVINDDQLYAALWGDRRAYQAIAKLMPTPTSTSTPSATATPLPDTITPSATAETPTTTNTSTPTATPTPLPGITRVRPNDDAIVVYVPEGDFIMGSKEEDSQADEDETPQTTIFLEAFWIDRYEVTNAQYKKFVDATNYRVPFIDEGWATRYNWTNETYPEGLADYPVMLVDWNDASAYCSWAGSRLPTEAEWEKAARGTDGRIYPWGDEIATCEYAVINEGVFGCGQNEPWSVGSKPAGTSLYGVLDMVGNVWEWTSSLYRSYPYDPNDGRESLEANGRRVARGGSWDDFNVVKRVRPAYRLAISPDSRNISLGFRCAISADSSPTITPTATSTPTPTATPPGGRIAFVSRRDGHEEIYIMYADGSGQTRLTDTSLAFTNFLGAREPSWSPNSQRIAFAIGPDDTMETYGKAEIYVMNANGRGLTRLTDNLADDWRPVWSPDGRRIAFESWRDGNGEIYLMSIDGSNQINLTKNPASDDRAPSWSPDGKRIVFSSEERGSNNKEIYIMNADGSQRTGLTNNPAEDRSPTWSPDGQRIVFESNRHDNAEIYVMSVNDSKPIRLTYHPALDRDPSWSPDGQRIIFESDRNGHYDIYVMNVDGNELTRLTNDPADDRWPFWSPK